DNSFKTVRPGDYLTGRVVKVDDSEGIYVDVGYKTEGLVPLTQISHQKNVVPSSIVKVGDEISVVVQRVDDVEGNLTLSKKRADTDNAWRRVTEAYNNGTILQAPCTEQVKGGLIVDVGMRGFLPASQVHIHPVRDLSEFIGEILNLKVIELDQAHRKVVLSRKQAEEELRKKAREEVMGKLEEGQIVTGKVARLTKFGAFIDLGDVDGLVHISQLSYKRIKDPGEVVQAGQTIDVLVLRVEPERDRISLSLRQAQPDPWKSVSEKYHVGDVIEVKVVRFAKHYTFAEVTDGIEGVIPVNELANHRVKTPEDVLQIDQVVKVRVMEVNPETRRMVLSVKKAAEDNNESAAPARSERGNRERNATNYSEASSNTLGDIFKAKGIDVDHMGE
ncbi:30S ribosomal protein S1, partial [bacterium]|nr:30S ribosomal protein S1 [bacterium]